MPEETEKTVKEYGQIMELCLLEAGRITSRYANAPELCRQITHDLFEAVTGESEKAAELDVLATLKDAADSYRTDRNASPVAEAFTALLGPFGPSVPDFVAGDSESKQDPVPFEPENGE